MGCGEGVGGGSGGLGDGGGGGRGDGGGMGNGEGFVVIAGGELSDNGTVTDLSS